MPSGSRTYTPRPLPVRHERAGLHVHHDAEELGEKLSAATLVADRHDGVVEDDGHLCSPLSMDWEDCAASRLR
jgi:hypothetical protein